MTRPDDLYDWQAWAWDTIKREGEALPGFAGLVLLLLAQYGDADGFARPSARTLAGYLGRTDKPVRRALDLLERRELIVAHERTTRRPVVWRLPADHAVRSSDHEPADNGVRSDDPPADHGVRSEPADHAVRSDDGLRTTASAASAPDCGPSADTLRTPGSAEGEGEGNRLLVTALQGADGGRQAQPRRVSSPPLRDNFGGATRSYGDRLRRWAAGIAPGVEPGLVRAGYSDCLLRGIEPTAVAISEYVDRWTGASDHDASRPQPVGAAAP